MKRLRYFLIEDIVQNTIIIYIIIKFIPHPLLLGDEMHFDIIMTNAF